MRVYRLGVLAAVSSVLLGAADFAAAQRDSITTITHIANTYQVVANITYRTASNWDGKLDVYMPRGLNGPNPVVMYFHGGGWTAGTKEGATYTVLPYLEMGWTVVNVEYRLTSVALAPAAVEDTRCALRWVYRNAKEYHFDIDRIVTTGESAGGHLALITGMLPASTPFDHTCPSDRSGGASGSGARDTAALKVAAIVDWYGISDVHELLSGATMKSYAVAWFGALPYRDELATQLSPETYVKPGIPPIISVHGDADPTVPYSQKERLHAALDRAGLSHQLVTIAGGRHGFFTDSENMVAYSNIRRFLAAHGLAPQADHPTAPAQK